MMNAEWLCTTDIFGETPLTRVSKAGRMELANIMLMQELEDHLRYVGYMPPLHRAAYFDYGDAIEDLIEDGVDPSEQNDRGETALHLAVRLGNENAVRALLKSGMDVDAPSSLGMTALHWATLTGQRRIAELLVAHGANPQAHEWISGGLTPIRMAHIMGYHDLAETLELGANAWYA